MAGKRTGWRCLDTGASNGATNMAIDEALVRCGQDSPVLRFYRWSPPAISLGFHQHLAEVDAARCLHDGVDVVRRPTGGRAVYHANELTYSVTIPKGHELYALPPLEVYDLVSSAIVAGLRILDPRLALQRVEEPVGSGDYSGEFECFATSAPFEIQAESKKLAGSAQRRYKAGLLQHGSIMLTDEHLRLRDYLADQAPAHRKPATFLQNRTISLEALLGRTVSYREVAQCLVAGFQSFFEIHLQTSVLSHSERALSEKLIPKYTNAGGNHHEV